MDLFVLAFPAIQRTDPLFSALEKTAEKTHRVRDLVALYRKHAPEDRRLHGRIKRLAKRGLAPEGDRD